MLSQQEKTAVIGNDVDALSTIIEKQQALLDDIKKIEDERVCTLSGICSDIGLPKSKSRLRDIIAAAPSELREKLQNLAAELEKTAAKLRRAGIVNKMLIDAQLQYTSFCINLLTGSQSTLNTYSGFGRREEGCQSGRGLVDQTV
jgi:flagellar biosynthesis/type III secretory pathway chaperone